MTLYCVVVVGICDGGPPPAPLFKKSCKKGWNTLSFKGSGNNRDMKPPTNWLGEVFGGFTELPKPIGLSENVEKWRKSVFS